MVWHGVNKFVRAGIRYELLESARFAEAADLFRRDFFVNETLSKALGKKQDARQIEIQVKDLEECMGHGLSWAAVDENTNELVGVMVNGHRFTQDRDKTRSKLKESYAGRFTLALEHNMDLFSVYEVNSYTELCATTVHRNYISRGIGKTLTVDLGLHYTIYRKVLAVTITTTPVTLGMFRPYGFRILNELKPYEYRENGDRVFLYSDPNHKVQLLARNFATK